ncbi:MAG TPA: hypothetical protein VFZ65_07645, partial [Planctomycetota bacterium]|nr:hypothetical protein [Planctomycetota bacterium]
MRTPRPFLLLAALPALGCRAEPLGLPEPPPRHVVIDNRSGETLSLLAVTRTGYAGIPGADLGRAS